MPRFTCWRGQKTTGLNPDRETGRDTSSNPQPQLRKTQIRKAEVHVHLCRFRLKELTAESRTTREENHPPPREFVSFQTWGQTPSVERRRFKTCLCRSCDNRWAGKSVFFSNRLRRHCCYENTINYTAGRLINTNMEHLNDGNHLAWLSALFSLKKKKKAVVFKSLGATLLVLCNLSSIEDQLKFFF